ncbi:SLATT domain-containing protein [Deinococcus proteolyticus]|uniref:SLATT domain-containing protein n=1 Tax=Deinococcus proteolyticus TaxID=55148 RepID=UPI001FDFD76D|nr:SLATT domain-containing protein [Deinococcus proteolyticus]
MRQLYGRTAYSHKTHEKQADLELELYKRLTNGQIWFSALTTTSLILALLGDNKLGTIVGALIATLQFGLTIYLKEINLQEKASSHSETAQALWSVREDLMSLITDMHDNRLDIDEVVEKRREMLDRLLHIYSASLRTSSRAYAMAQNSLKRAGDLSFGEEELDNLIN